MVLQRVLKRFGIVDPQSRSTQEFAVVDVETTGLYPNSHDRIVEIAVVRVSSSGGIRGEYTTLVNPERDVGATRIHGITAAQVRSAPRFKEIAGDVLDMVSGVPVAAHNSMFDLGFLRAEFSRIGVDLPELPTVCTLDLAHRVQLPTASRSLSSCCQALGIDHINAHAALGDARATAKLLCLLLGRVGYHGAQSASPVARGAFPQLPRGQRAWTREVAEVEIRSVETYLARLVSKLPLSSADEVDHTQSLVSYFDVLDRALADRYISEDEADSLADLATNWGMNRETVDQAHYQYLRQLANAALEDGEVTSAERRDLDQVARWLGIPEQHVENLLLESSVATQPKPAGTRIDGKSVCFTGDSTCTIGGIPISRASAERLASEAGAVVKSGVSKKLDYLVIADPLSQSGKATKARQYGIVILSEHVFWQMIGVRTD